LEAAVPLSDNLVLIKSSDLYTPIPIQIRYPAPIHFMKFKVFGELVIKVSMPNAATNIWMELAVRSPKMVYKLFLNRYLILIETMSNWLLSGGVAKNTATATRYARYASIEIRGI